MIAESFWNHLKNGVLASFSRPRLDLVTHLFIKQVLPDVKRKLSFILGHRRKGRPCPIAPWQEDFKAEWKQKSSSDETRLLLEKLRLEAMNPKSTKAKTDRNTRLDWIREAFEQEAGTYHTSVQKWTCSCPSYLLNRFLLCKHLVREVNELSPTGSNLGLRFFKKLRRRHEAPYYHIPFIHGEDTDGLEDVVLDGETGEEEEEEGRGGAEVVVLEGLGVGAITNVGQAVAVGVGRPNDLVAAAGSEELRSSSPRIGDEGWEDEHVDGVGQVRV